MVNTVNTLILLVSLASFRGRGSRSLSRAEDRLRHTGDMFASSESLDKTRDTGRRKKIRFNPYHEFSD